MGAIKWTRVMREQMFNTLLNECGAYSEWETVYYPKKSGSKQYGLLLNRIAEGLTKLYGVSFSKGAVAEQIAWALTRQHEIKARGQMRTHYLNVAAALESGFMTYNDLPSLILKEG